MTISILIGFLTLLIYATAQQEATTAGAAILVGAGDISSCDNVNDEATAKPLDGNFTYFSGIPAYYACDPGAWRIYALNSERDVSAGSPQVEWLENDLAANPRLCVLAYWHKPLWLSRYDNGSDTRLETLWQTLHDAGAELVINGHIHNYEWFKEMNAGGVAAGPGLHEIAAGTGGVNHDGYVSSLSTSEVRNGSTYGVLKLILSPAHYSWQFVPVAEASFTDSGTTSCQ